MVDVNQLIVFNITLVIVPVVPLISGVVAPSIVSLKKSCIRNPDDSSRVSPRGGDRGLTAHLVTWLPDVLASFERGLNGHLLRLYRSSPQRG